MAGEALVVARPLRHVVRVVMGTQRQLIHPKHTQPEQSIQTYAHTLGVMHPPSSSEASRSLPAGELRADTVVAADESDERREGDAQGLGLMVMARLPPPPSSSAGLAPCCCSCRGAASLGSPSSALSCAELVSTRVHMAAPASSVALEVLGAGGAIAAGLTVPCVYDLNVDHQSTFIVSIRRPLTSPSLLPSSLATAAASFLPMAAPPSLLGTCDCGCCCGWSHPARSGAHARSTRSGYTSPK